MSRIIDIAKLIHLPWLTLEIKIKTAKSRAQAVRNIPEGYAIVEMYKSLQNIVLILAIRVSTSTEKIIGKIGASNHRPYE
jgi:hypothetical protein